MKKPSIKDRAMTVGHKAGGSDLNQDQLHIPTHVEVEPMTAPGSMMAFLGKQSAVIAANEQLKEELAEWEGAVRNRKIDPRHIRVSRWANRGEASFKGPAFERFKDEIAAAGGNVQPIKVRPIPARVGGERMYEVIFGHRRHRACLELGIDVFSIIEEATDIQLFEAMDRENRERADLRPYEQGEMYRKALDEGLFPSLRKLAESLGLEPSGVSKVVTLARLPADVIAAFKSPLDLQYGWAPKLTQALKTAPDLVLARAKEMQTQVPRLSANQVFKRLVELGVSPGHTPNPPPRILNGTAGQGAEINVDATARTMTINLKNLDVARLDEVEKAIQLLII